MNGRQVAKDTLALLRSELSIDGSSLEERAHDFSIDIPPAPRSDYRFFVSVEKDLASASVGADLLEAPGRDFWYYPFEPVEGIERRTIDSLQWTLRRLLARESRIVQRRRWLFWALRCEWRVDGAWKRVYSMGYFRFGRFRVPEIGDKERIYRAHPHVGAAR